MLGESDLHPVSPKTPAPQYRPIERNKGKTVEDKKGASSLGQLEKIGSALNTRQFHNIEYKASKIVPPDTEKFMCQSDACS